MLRSIIAVVAVAMLSTAAIAAVDPFDAARSHLQARQNAEALAIVDSGQVDVNTQTDEGYTLLHHAAGAGNLEMVKALLARGADPTLKTNLGYTPYMSAIGTMVKAEIRNAVTRWNGGGATPRTPANAEPRNPASPPAARRPASNGMCDMARANPANSGRSPAMRPFLQAKDAVWYNHPDELAGLIQDCVGVDQQDEYGWTLLHHAADRDRVALARILIDHGARRNLRNKDGQTAPQLAKSAEMKALLGAAAAGPRPSPAGTASSARKTECEQKYRADAALASDTTGRMSAMRRWQQCLNTGRYW